MPYIEITKLPISQPAAASCWNPGILSALRLQPPGHPGIVEWAYPRKLISSAVPTRAAPNESRSVHVSMIWKGRKEKGWEEKASQDQVRQDNEVQYSKSVIPL